MLKLFVLALLSAITTATPLPSHWELITSTVVGLDKNVWRCGAQCYHLMACLTKCSIFMLQLHKPSELHKLLSILSDYHWTHMKFTCTEVCTQLLIGMLMMYLSLEKQCAAS